jgi:hypothetical protein
MSRQFRSQKPTPEAKTLNRMDESLDRPQNLVNQNGQVRAQSVRAPPRGVKLRRKLTTLKVGRGDPDRYASADQEAAPAYKTAPVKKAGR